MIPLRTTWDKRKSFLVHLYQKDLKSVRKWLSYCHFLPERLRDSIENHMGPRGILLCSFLPKGSTTSQEIAEIWNLPTERLRDSIENNTGQKGVLWCSFVPKISKFGQEMAELWIFPPERLHDSMRTRWDKGGSLGVHLYQKYLKSVKKWLSYGIFPLRGCVIPL